MTVRAASPARTRAVAVLREVLEKGKRATPTLAVRSEGLSAADANLMRELTLGVLRWKSALDSELASVCRFPLAQLAPNVREILEVALYQIRYLDRIPDHAAVDEAVRHARARGGARAAKFVNAVLRGLLRASPSSPWGEARGGAQDARTLARGFSHPEFLVARWIDRLGLETARRILEADNAPSKPDLMVNPRKGSRDLLAANLAAEGIEAEPSEASPLGLIVQAGNPLRSPLFRAGRFTVQDIGSQVLPLLLPAGETLVDLAAAPGGKSLAALLLGRARRSVALDRSIPRLSLLIQNCRRLGVVEISPVAADLSALPLPAGRFERVLFDAPCSGTGTLRKNPEIRYRVTPVAIDRLAAAQRGGLRAAADLLEPGGYLLYSTCSLEQEENEAVVDGLLSGSSCLELARIDPPPALAPFIVGARFEMLPGPTNDGFKAHLLRRRS